ncbi:HAMP domain-containing histidine kinase [candidate division KSB1 bacterium]|nr:HAMP domain-containing histidine kinase [candidate division KSB1 bacterium]
MKRRQSFFFQILIFVIAQLAWLSLLGLWIYWYVTNYIIFSQVGEKLSPQLISESKNIGTLVGGLVLLVAVSVGMILLFRHLTIQMKMTGLYDNFIANVTHELKSPLASIQLYLETMKKNEIPRPKQQDFIELMLKDTSRLNNLINSILEIPGLEQKKIAHSFSVYMADTLIHELVNEAVKQYKLPGNAIIIKGKASCECVVDRDAYKIVINNLVDNAVKYSAGSVQITVRLFCSVKNFVLEFSDQGIGISSVEQKKVFEKFYRIYNESIPSVKGTGLGLYWAKEIIRNHGGQISVMSKGKNKGTTFRIELPIYQTSKKRYIEKLLKITRKQPPKESDE